VGSCAEAKDAGERCCRLCLGRSSSQAVDEGFNLLESSADFGFAFAQFIGRGALMDSIFEFSHGNAE